MSLLLVSWVKVDVSHAGLASICHRPEKSVAISRWYAGDSRHTVIHSKRNYKNHQTSANVPFHIRARLLRSKCISKWHREDLWVSKTNRIRVSRDQVCIEFASDYALKIKDCELKIRIQSERIKIKFIWLNLSEFRIG